MPPSSAAAAASAFEVKVRIVPITLPDGTVLRRDPDESVEIKTEFTNYCHQEYADGGEEEDGAKDDAAIVKSLLQKANAEKGEGTESPTATKGIAAPPTDPSSGRSKERVVPITLSNGEKFHPTFTRLSDLEPPDWSSFGSPSRNKDESASGVSGNHHETKETVVPIRVDGEQNPRGGRSAERKRTTTAKEEKEDSNRAKKSSSINDDGGGDTVFGGKSETREREEGVETTRTKKTLTTTDKTTKRSEQKKVQHTVRFNIDENKSHGEGGRSSSLESHFRDGFISQTY